MCQSRGVFFVLNDRADLVVGGGCDGVGQEDMPSREAQHLIGPNRTLGVTGRSSLNLRRLHEPGERPEQRVCKTVRVTPGAPTTVQ